jgi:hypothetical protein
MEKIGFIGAYDKTDLIMNVAKILASMNVKVIVLDSTITQKAKYVVPSISPTLKYVTNFEDIDVAVGFETFDEIAMYLGVDYLNYDIALIDVDTVERIEKLQLQVASKNFFVTAFDLYSLKRGLEILSRIREPMNLTKIMYSKDMIKEEEDYLDFLAMDYKIIWDEFKIYFPLENGDMSVLAENQRVSKIKFKRLSANYKDNLAIMVEMILKDVSPTQIRKTIRSIEKGV